MAVPFCAGEVIDVAGSPACVDDMGAPIAWESVPTFTVEAIDPAVASSAFAGGFVIVGSAWAIGWTCRQLLSMVRR